MASKALLHSGFNLFQEKLMHFLLLDVFGYPTFNVGFNRKENHKDVKGERSKCARLYWSSEMMVEKLRRKDLLVPNLGTGC